MKEILTPQPLLKEDRKEFGTMRDLTLLEEIWAIHSMANTD